ncbi:MAG: trigger factor [Kiloniellales bacterium]|nr:trigger factor [Kiloniellales bacterium]
MQVMETNSDGLMREFKVVVDAKDINDKLENRLQEIGQQVNLPGFRPGKAPVHVLKQRFGQSVMGEILEKAVQDSSSQAMMERGLRPALQPKIEITSFDQGKDLEYTLAIELLPEIEIADLSQVALTRLKVAAPDEEVEDALERLAASKKQTAPLEAPRKAESGDVLVIDFRGSVDGEELPGMAAEDHHLELGSNQFVGTFEDQLIGVDKGESRQVTVTFPEAYVNEKLANKEAVFDVTVKDILATQPPAIDDELAKSLGQESLESLRGQVREQIEREYGQLTRAKMKRELLDRLSETHEFPVPAGMVETEFGVIWGQIESERKEGRLDPEDEGKSEDDLKAEYRQIAERRVRLGLLLSEIGRVNGIEVGEEEVNQALLREAQRHPGQEREVYEYFQRTPEAMANLRAPIFEDKVIDYIVEMATVTERDLSPEDLRKEMEAEAAEDKKGQEPTEGSAQEGKQTSDEAPKPASEDG